MLRLRLAGMKSMQGKQNRLFLRILGCFLSLLIPIIIIGVIEYGYSVHMMKKEFNQRISNNLKSAATSVDSFIKTSQVTGVNFLFDETVQRLLMPKDAQSLEVKSELWRLPRILQRHENIVSRFTDSIFVYMDNQDVYVSGGVNSFSSFFNNMYRYENYSADYWINKHSSDKQIELLSVSKVYQNKNNMKRVLPIVMVHRVGNQNAVMVFNLSIKVIEQTLKGSAVFDSTGFVVIDGNRQIMYDGHGFLGAISASDLSDMVNADSGTQEIKIDSKPYMVAHIQSDVYGLDYYSFTPAAEFNRHTVSILQMTLLLCIVLIVMGVVFSFVFSLRIYNPIRNIRDIIAQQSRPDDAENEDNANEFELIRQGITRMSHSHQQYKMKYDKHTSEYVEYSLLFLLKGHTLNEEEILRETLKADFGFTRTGFVCCAVLFDFKEAFYGDIQDTERTFVTNGIKKIIWNLLVGEFPAYVLEPRPNLYVCLANLDGEWEMERLQLALNRMLDIFGYDIRMYYDIAVGIGTFYRKVNEIGISFNEAMTTVSKRDKDQRFQIILSNRMTHNNSYYYTIYDEQKIMNCLKLGEEASLRSVVKVIMDSNEQSGISYEHMLQLYKEMYAAGVRLLSEKGVDVEKLEIGRELRLLHAPESAHSLIGLDELQGALLSFYCRIIETIKAQKGQNRGNLVTLIEQYIQHHYTEDLGLEQIADKMGVSVKYVSRIFIEKTGIYITDYINRVRIEKAKELLEQADLKVNDIAERVGIHSRTTFLRVFKKVEGISPNEYRTLHKQEKTG